MTRAKDALHLIMPQRFYVARPGRARRPPRLRLAHAASSRPRILAAFEQQSWPAIPALAGEPAEPQLRIDLKSRMLGMWR